MRVLVHKWRHENAAGAAEVSRVQCYRRARVTQHARRERKRDATRRNATATRAFSRVASGKQRDWRRGESSHEYKARAWRPPIGMRSLLSARCSTLSSFLLLFSPLFLSSSFVSPSQHVVAALAQSSGTPAFPSHLTRKRTSRPGPPPVSPCSHTCSLVLQRRFVLVVLLTVQCSVPAVHVFLWPSAVCTCRELGRALVEFVAILAGHLWSCIVTLLRSSNYKANENTNN